jgi:hypothetical protein
MPERVAQFLSRDEHALPSARGFRVSLPLIQMPSYSLSTGWLWPGNEETRTYTICIWSA